MTWFISAAGGCRRAASAGAAVVVGVVILAAVVVGTVDRLAGTGTLMVVGDTTAGRVAPGLGLAGVVVGPAGPADGAPVPDGLPAALERVVAGPAAAVVPAPVAPAAQAAAPSAKTINTADPKATARGWRALLTG